MLSQFQEELSTDLLSLHVFKQTSQMKLELLLQMLMPLVQMVTFIYYHHLQLGYERDKRYYPVLAHTHRSFTYRSD